MKLREARFYAGLSQYDVALKTGIPQSKISLIERSYVNPNQDEIKKLSSLFNTNETKLFFDDREKKNE
tara:strand:- start:984 stop:1187 length:204 start_codon:yes stop_codon:yes gene_type:complete